MGQQRPDEPGGQQPCPVCDGQPRVLVAIQHPSMLRFTREFLERECGCGVATEAHTGPALAHAVDRIIPDLLIIAAADFPACCLSAITHVPRGRIIVIGPEPDPAYRSAAMRSGAGGWLAREAVGDHLGAEMRRVLGCLHDPCPPGRTAAVEVSRAPGRRARPSASRGPARDGQ